jgi:2-C-methyl-D-erythritol 4-phosphate cytidylyltransferase/2-C-methyl-D-erythritol 2,4-cyclodiphosphate synthase
MTEPRSHTIGSGKVGIVLPAAGSGSRMGSPTPKQYLTLAGKPILIHTLAAVLRCPLVTVAVVAVAQDQHENLARLLQRYFPPVLCEKIIVTTGGATRQLSVRAGIDAMPDPIDLILVHDAARPLITSEAIEGCVKAIQAHGAAIVAIPVNDTLKLASLDGMIGKTIDRTNLYRALTPQGAKKELFARAYLQAEGDGFTGTDEASLFEHAGIPVAIVPGEESNIKITRPDDLNIARTLLEEKKMIRIGHGFDAHRLVTDRPLILGGVTIDYEKGLLGHSDADVLTHALIDAILGALGKGDIGRHFPDNDDRYKGINSLKLLNETIGLTIESKAVLVNADLTIICQAPRLAAYLDTMRHNLAGACKVNGDRINIKATTTEKMGYSGRGEGIAAHAVVLLEVSDD